MLCSLLTVKSRLGLDPLDPTYDPLLQRTIAAISARFDMETNRTLARTENAVYEFPAGDTEIQVPCYPIESVARFEIKASEIEGWSDLGPVECLVHRRCVISLTTPIDRGLASVPVARVIYTGGYVLPEAADPETGNGAAPERLPAELEQAAVEQSAFWFQTRDQVGVVREWPTGGGYKQLADPDLLPSVREVLRRYARLVL